jgi:NADH-quinone oxidoreductase subunit G
MSADTLIVDGREVRANGERNLLEVIRKAGIHLPTFCYHSNLSVYGACRLCLVDVEGRGLHASCSIQAEPGMVVRTNTEELREIRKISVELLLANHDQHCPTCPQSGSCQLQSLARKMGIERVRFQPTLKRQALDRSSPSLVRDPNRCVLCGDCVRMCDEVQGVGAIDFSFRGAGVQVGPAFGKDLSGVECVDCGQCSTVCPTGAITPKSDVDDVWRVLEDPTKTVVVQIAPAVRVALGESFGLEPGTVTTGLIASASRTLGFDKVFDTSFAADLTVIEEGTEFLQRAEKGERLPMFTSCCPGWVKFAEQYYPQLLPHLSSCRSPQQMFGSLAKATLPEQLDVKPEDLVVVSVMPCTAKKFEALRPEFRTGEIRHVDYVLTTQELSRMIEQAGIVFHELQPTSCDLPLGFKTGAAVIFGSSGGVSEAVARFAAEKITGVRLESPEFLELRGTAGLREATLTLEGKTIKLAVVHGLRRAREVAESVAAGTCDYDLIEVMACPGGCVGGAGQPVTRDANAVCRRSRGLYEADRGLAFRKSQDNPHVAECYQCLLGEAGSETSHELLHTHYKSRRRIDDESLELVSGTEKEKLTVRVCVGTSCYVRGSQDLLHALIKHLESEGLAGHVDVQATFCFEQCDRGPSISIGGAVLNRCTVASACAAVDEKLATAAPTPS